MRKQCFDTEKAWLDTRAKIITATEMGSLLGLDSWRTANKMWKEKIETRQGIRTFTGNSYTFMGQHLEPLVVEFSNYILDRDFRLFDEGHKVMYINDTCGYGATPDATDSLDLLECKSTKPHNFYRWSGHPPAKYLAQLYTQLLCTESKTGYLAILSTNLTQRSEELNIPIAIFRLDLDHRITKHIEKEVKRFWETVSKHKTFTVKTADKQYIEWLLRVNTVKIY